MWKWLEQYFTFTQGEKNGIIALVFLSVAVLIFPSVYLYFKPVQHIDSSKYEKEINAFANEHSSNSQAASPDTSEENYPGDSRKVVNNGPEKNSAVVFVDINTADSTEFEKLRGVGPALARRMVNFRNLLGGYVSREQIKEVYGFPDSTYQYLKSQFVVNKNAVKKININTAEYKELSKHPYVRPAAKAIIDYRKQQDNFKSVSDLKKAGSIPDSTYRKMEPYLTVKWYGKE